MITKIVSKAQIRPNNFLRRRAQESDSLNLISPPCKIVCDEKEVLLALDFGSSSEWYVTDVLKKIRYEESTRSSGLKTNSRIFGYKPKNHFRQFWFPSKTSLWSEAPLCHQKIIQMAEKIQNIYQVQSKEDFLKQKQMISKIHQDYRLGSTVFTSGIINKNNPLGYHFDSGNFVGVKSAMLVNSKNVAGGNLVLPEYDCKIEIKNNFVYIFDGQSVLHGVTPIIKKNQDSFRYSSVFYSLKAFQNYGSFADELKSAKTNEFSKLAPKRPSTPQN